MVMIDERWYKQRRDHPNYEATPNYENVNFYVLQLLESQGLASSSFIYFEFIFVTISFKYIHTLNFKIFTMN